MDRKSYYFVLDVPSSATQEQVQAAYKRLALLHHPDRSTDPQATRRMQLLNEAYEVLCSVERRAQYDREQAASNPPVEAGGRPPAGEKPPPEKQGDSQQQPKATAKGREEQAIARRAWMQAQLKVLLSLSILLTFLFFLSLLTGQVSLVAIFMIVIMAIVAIISIIGKIRNPSL